MILGIGRSLLAHLSCLASFHSISCTLENNGGGDDLREFRNYLVDREEQGLFLSFARSISLPTITGVGESTYRLSKHTPRCLRIFIKNTKYNLGSGNYA